MPDKQYCDDIDEQIEVEGSLSVTHGDMSLVVAAMIDVEQNREKENKADDEPPRNENAKKLLDFVDISFEQSLYDGGIYVCFKHGKTDDDEYVVGGYEHEAQILHNSSYAPHGREQKGEQTGATICEGKRNSRIEPFWLIEQCSDGIGSHQDHDAP